MTSRRAKLVAKTRQAKNILYQHGDEWDVYSIPPNVISMSPVPYDKFFAVSSKDGEARWFFKQEVDIIRP